MHWRIKLWFQSFFFIILTLRGVVDPIKEGHAGKGGDVACKGGRQARCSIPCWGTNILRNRKVDFLYLLLSSWLTSGGNSAMCGNSFLQEGRIASWHCKCKLNEGGIIVLRLRLHVMLLGGVKFVVSLCPKKQTKKHLLLMGIFTFIWSRSERVRLFISGFVRSRKSWKWFFLYFLMRKAGNLSSIVPFWLLMWRFYLK